MAKHIVFFACLSVAFALLLVYVVALQKKNISLSTVLSNTNFADGDQCSAVLQGLSEAVSSCATGDAGKVSSVVGTVASTIAAKKQRAMEDVCTMCTNDPALCMLEPKLDAWIRANCVQATIADVPVPDIPVVVVPPQPTPIDTTPMIPQMSIQGATDSSITFQWPQMQTGITPVLKMTSPVETIVDNIQEGVTEFTWPSTQSAATDSLTPNTKYKFALGARRGNETFMSSMEVAASTMEVSKDIPLFSLDAASLSSTAASILWRQPSYRGTQVVLRITPGKAVDSFQEPVVVDNTSPGKSVSHAFTNLQPFSWYSIGLGIRVPLDNGVTDLWSDVSLFFRTLPVPFQCTVTASGSSASSAGIQVKYTTPVTTAISAMYTVYRFIGKGASLSADFLANNANGKKTGMFYNFGEGNMQPSTTYTFALKFERLFTDLTVDTTSPLRTYKQVSIFPATFTTLRAPYMDPAFISASATHNSIELTWTNKILPVGYGSFPYSVVLFSPGTSLNMVQEGVGIISNSLVKPPGYIASPEADEQFRIFSATTNSTCIISELKPGTTYTVAIAVLLNSQVFVETLKTMTLTTSSAPPSGVYPILQSVLPRPVGLRVQWFRPPSDVLAMIQNASLYITPSGSSSGRNTLFPGRPIPVKVDANATGDQSVPDTLGAIDVGPLDFEQGRLFTVALAYNFKPESGLSKAISKPRSQTCLTRPFPPFSGNITYEVKAASGDPLPGSKSSIVVLHWDPLVLDPVDYPSYTVSAVMDGSVSVPLSATTNTVAFTAASNTEHTFSIVYDNPVDAQTVSDTLRAFVEDVPFVVPLSIAALSGKAIIAWDNAWFTSYGYSMSILYGRTGEAQGTSMGSQQGARCVVDGLRPETEYWVEAALTSSVSGRTTVSRTSFVTQPLVTIVGQPSVSQIRGDYYKLSYANCTASSYSTPWTLTTTVAGQSNASGDYLTSDVYFTLSPSNSYVAAYSISRFTNLGGLVEYDSLSSPSGYIVLNFFWQISRGSTVGEGSRSLAVTISWPPLSMPSGLALTARYQGAAPVDVSNQQSFAMTYDHADEYRRFPLRLVLDLNVTEKKSGAVVASAFNVTAGTYITFRGEVRSLRFNTYVDFYADTMLDGPDVAYNFMMMDGTGNVPMQVNGTILRLPISPDASRKTLRGYIWRRTPGVIYPATDEIVIEPREFPNFTLARKDATSLTYSWTPFTYGYLFYAVDGVDTANSVQPGQTTITIPNLVPGTTYLIKMGRGTLVPRAIVWEYEDSITM